MPGRSRRDNHSKPKKRRRHAALLLAKSRKGHMQITENELSTSLDPVCPRDDHHMKYEAKGISWKAAPSDKTPQHLPSYHCNFVGCSVRYDLLNGYCTVVFTPDQPFFIEEPGVNILPCPRHGTWLYRTENRDGDTHFSWRCGVEGCDYVRADVARI
jgi:hypothetical protein